MARSDRRSPKPWLTGGTKGFKFVCNGPVTFNMDWNKADEGNGNHITKIMIGAAGRHPNASTFNALDPTDPTVIGMPPASRCRTVLPIMQIGFNRASQQWTSSPVQTKLNLERQRQRVQRGVPAGEHEHSGDRARVHWGLWPKRQAADYAADEQPGGSSDATRSPPASARPVQCEARPPGDFDNDMWVDLYLACRTGASNIPSILYHNNGDWHLYRRA